MTLPHGQILTETTGASTTAYTYGLDRLSAATSEGVTTRYVHDGRGSVAQAVVTVPNVSIPSVQSYAYTPFGEQIGLKASGFGYNAELFDAATGMQYLRARYYEPGMGRFGQKDLLRGTANNPLGLNRYLYVRNDPLNLVDPSGMEACPQQTVKQAAFPQGAVVTSEKTTQVGPMYYTAITKTTYYTPSEAIDRYYAGEKARIENHRTTTSSGGMNRGPYKGPPDTSYA